jgi:hypothetical protein
LLKRFQRRSRKLWTTGSGNCSDAVCRHSCAEEKSCFRTVHRSRTENKEGCPRAKDLTTVLRRAGCQGWVLEVEKYSVERQAPEAALCHSRAKAYLGSMIEGTIMQTWEGTEGGRKERRAECSK